MKGENIHQRTKYYKQDGKFSHTKLKEKRRALKTNIDKGNK